MNQNEPPVRRWRQRFAARYPRLEAALYILERGIRTAVHALTAALLVGGAVSAAVFLWRYRAAINIYSPAIQALSTIVLIGVTTLYVIVTKRTLDQLRETHYRHANPVLHVEICPQIDATSSSVSVSITNYGTGPALRFRVSVTCRDLRPPGDQALFRSLRDLPATLRPAEHTDFAVALNGPVPAHIRFSIRGALEIVVLFTDVLGSAYQQTCMYDLNGHGLVQVEESLWREIGGRRWLSSLPQFSGRLIHSHIEPRIPDEFGSDRW